MTDPRDPDAAGSLPVEPAEPAEPGEASTGADDAERRALSDAVRDALAARAETGEQAFTPVRTRPMLPRALDTRAIPMRDGARDDASVGGDRDPASAPADRAVDEPVPGGEIAPDDEHAQADGPAPVDEAVSDDEATRVDETVAPITSASPASATWADIEPIPEHDLVDSDSAPARAHPADDETGQAHPSASDGPAFDEQASDGPASDGPATDRLDPMAAPAASAASAASGASVEHAPTDAVPVEADADPDGPSSLEASVRLDEPASARRRFTGRGAIVVGARALAGIAGIGIAAIAIAGSTIAPLPRYTSAPPELTVSPVAAAQQRVCPGPLLRLGNDEGQEATSATSVGRPIDQYQAEPRAAEADALPETENSTGVAPLLLTLPPGSGTDQQVAAVAGSQTQSVRSGDLVGLASAECAEAGGEIWLVGGSTDVGRTTLITLSNPTTVLATVRMRVFGPAGEIVAPGLDGIVVPPGSQRIFSLAGFAPQLAAPVVKVESRGGLVVANLQQTTVRTLDPGGVDIVGATRAPSTELTIPGVLVSGSAQISGAQDQVGFDDLQATLRIFNPGTDTATSTVSITPSRGTAAPPRSDSVAVEGTVSGSPTDEGGFEVEVAPGQVTEIPFPGLADGDYTISVVSDAPVVAGARVSTVSEDGASDFAWLPAATTLRDRALVSIASGPSPVLRLVNPTDQEQTVTVSTPDDELDVVLDPGESVPTPMRAGQDATLTGAAGMLATVTYLGTGQISAFGLTSPGPASGDIVVYR